MQQEQINKLNELRQFIDTNCIFRCDPTKIYSESIKVGKIPSINPLRTNTFQFMLRRLTHDAKMLSYISSLMFEKILKSMQHQTEYPAIQLCGLETSSIPIMIGIQQYALIRYGIAINSFSVKKERKNTGIFNLIDGMPNELPVIVVDDVINSGNSILRALDTCFYELQLEPAKNMYTIMNFGNLLVQKKQWKNYNFDVHSLFCQNEFNTEFDPEKYWLPKDCDRSYNKRPEYR